MRDLKPYELLGAAIVERAILDYKEAIDNKLTLEKELAYINSKIEELNMWFKSEWFLDITCDKIDPGYILRKVDNKKVSDYENKRQEKYIIIKADTE